MSVSELSTFGPLYGYHFSPECFSALYDGLRMCFGIRKKDLHRRRHSIIAGKEDVVDAWSDYIGDRGPCPYDYQGEHDWKETGKTRLGRIFGDSWPDEEMKCTRCGKTG